MGAVKPPGDYDGDDDAIRRWATVALYPDALGWLREALALNAEEPTDEDDGETIWSRCATPGLRKIGTAVSGSNDLGVGRAGPRGLTFGKVTLSVILASACRRAIDPARCDPVRRSGPVLTILAKGNIMNTLVEGTLAVPGASLYYQVRGAGPTLLLMSGGHGDANSFDGMVAALAEHFTVVTYDRRGYTRSPLADPAAPQTVATHGDDAAALLRAVDKALEDQRQWIRR